MHRPVLLCAVTTYQNSFKPAMDCMAPRHSLSLAYANDDHEFCRLCSRRGKIAQCHFQART